MLYLRLCEIKGFPNHFLKKAHEKISCISKNINVIFPDNINISNIDLFDAGLHSVKPGTCILANNDIDRINIFLLTDLNHSNIHRYTME